MSKIIIIYASLTGNTEEIAELIAEGARSAGAEVSMKLVDECNAVSLLEADGYLLGAYTWGDGELPDEFVPFIEEMEELDLKGSRAAVFGSGDTGYPIYCGAVDELERVAKEQGAVLMQESLKIEYGPRKEEKDLCRSFGAAFAASLKS